MFLGVFWCCTTYVTPTDGQNAPQTLKHKETQLKRHHLWINALEFTHTKRPEVHNIGALLRKQQQHAGISSTGVEVVQT